MFDMLQGNILIRASLDEYDYDWCEFEVTITKGCPKLKSILVVL
ncbi:hypothetical protein GCM10023259_103890 [Thermocatellispora tengchongensis]